MTRRITFIVVHSLHSAAWGNLALVLYQNSIYIYIRVGCIRTLMRVCVYIPGEYQLTPSEYHSTHLVNTIHNSHLVNTIYSSHLVNTIYSSHLVHHHHNWHSPRSGMPATCTVSIYNSFSSWRFQSICWPWWYSSIHSLLSLALLRRHLSNQPL